MTGEIVANTTKEFAQVYASIAADDSGGFAVVWQGNGGDDRKNVMFRHFDGTGTALSDEVVVNETTDQIQKTPSIAMTTSGDFVVTWSGNGDGDNDVLSASAGDNTIAWYENTDGRGTFGGKNVITANAADARSVYGCDLDGDGDIDVLSASAADDKIAWYENIDGRGAFVDQNVIADRADGAQSVFATDLDRDGDMDVLSTSAGDNTIAWYENTDGKGSFGGRRLISVRANGATSVNAIDLDRDGDADVLSVAAGDGKVTWHENRPLGDANGDGDFDTSDLVQVFAWGQYEDGITGNSGFAQGDWNGDGEFDSADLVAAFQAGNFE